MRPPILRWKVALALVGVVVVGVVLGSVLGPSGQTYSSSGVQYFVGNGMNSAHIGRTIPIYSPASAPPRMRRQMCANLRADMPNMSKAERHEFSRLMPGFCKRR